MPLLWLDLETTGLNPETDKVLEVAAIATDDSLNEIARFHRVTTEASNVDLSLVDREVLEMHARSGLWTESMLASDQIGSLKSESGRDSSSNISCVDLDLGDFIARYCAPLALENGLTVNIRADVGGAKNGPQLAGSTISFDRAFLARHLPGAHCLLHYRNLDVSSLNEMARRFWPTVFEGRPKGESVHRAMDDIEASLRIARYYVEKLGPVSLSRASDGKREKPFGCSSDCRAPGCGGGCSQ